MLFYFAPSSFTHFYNRNQRHAFHAALKPENNSKIIEIIGIHIDTLIKINKRNKKRNRLGHQKFARHTRFTIRKSHFKRERYNKTRILNQIKFYWQSLRLRSSIHSSVFPPPFKPNTRVRFSSMCWSVRVYALCLCDSFFFFSHLFVYSFWCCFRYIEKHSRICRSVHNGVHGEPAPWCVSERRQCCWPGPLFMEWVYYHSAI